MNKTTNNITIDDIENLSEEEAAKIALESCIIKDHQIYFIDFHGSFGFSCLVYHSGKHIYYANDYELHHPSADGDKNMLKKMYIESLNNKLYTENEINEPIKSYSEYTAKDHFIRNYYGMRFSYCSIFRLPSDPERPKEYKYYSDYSFSYYNDIWPVEKIKQLASQLSARYNEFIKSFDGLKEAFLDEMYNHEYPINWQGDFDVLSCFYRVPFLESDLLGYFDYLKLSDTERRAYIAARKECISNFEN